MKLTFRWYGKNDSISLNYIRQIPNMSGVVTALYDVPVGEAWKEQSLIELKKLCNENELEMEVIESIPVHEEIKYGGPNRDYYIENYIKNIELVAKHGVKCICYNFMPVFDWLRTNMHHQNEDGSNSLSYSYEEFKKVDPNNLHLPGWDESYTKDELNNLLKIYQKMSHEDLFNNLVYFLNKIIPVCEKCNVNMAIHPDDPPWDIFNLPRIVSNEQDLDKMFNAVLSKRNGLTLCTGSFGASKNNDLVHMANKYASQGRVHFLHMRNILYTDDHDSFCEVGHCSSSGSINMAKIVEALVNNNFNGYVRPDHGRNIFGEDGKPGYGLYDRALGANYINGLFEAFEYMKKKGE